MNETATNSGERMKLWFSTRVGNTISSDQEFLITTSIYLSITKSIGIVNLSVGPTSIGVKIENYNISLVYFELLRFSISGIPL